MYNHKEACKALKQKSRRSKPSNKAILMASKKRVDSKSKQWEDMERQKAAEDDAKWSVGTDTRRQSKLAESNQKKAQADRKRAQKLKLEQTEQAELLKIKQLRKNKGRSQSMGETPPLRPRRARSASMDETLPNPEWKTPPKLNRQKSATAKQKITVLTMNGDDIPMFLPKTSTILDIKKRVELVKGIPAVSQELLSPEQERPLDDKQTLQELRLPKDSTIFCTNHAGTTSNWATFQHFRSPQKKKKHVEFSNDQKTATKTSAHPSATYVFTAGAVTGGSGPVRVWQLHIHCLHEEGGMELGLFQGRELKLEQHPFPVVKSKTAALVVDRQSPMWCISTAGKYRSPDEDDFMPARSSSEWSKRRFSEGDVLQVALHPEKQEISFHVTRMKTADPADSDNGSSGEETPDPAAPIPEHLYTLPMGLSGKSADDLHFFATLYSKGDSVTIKEII